MNKNNQKDIKNMQTITLQTIKSASLSDLRLYAVDHGIFIEGDKRKKISFITSITNYLIECSEQETVELNQEAAEYPIKVTPSAATPLTMFAPLAMIIFGALAAAIWLSVRAIIAIKDLTILILPLIDRILTNTLEATVNLTEFLFGDDFDQYSASYLEVKELMES